ncbi:MAG: transposase, partial [Verrucomicrobia bacterium]|nr:transposase [Verrucomicrobiota bacterium]
MRSVAPALSQAKNIVHFTRNFLACGAFYRVYEHGSISSHRRPARRSVAVEADHRRTGGGACRGPAAHREATRGAGGGAAADRDGGCQRQLPGRLGAVPGDHRAAAGAACHFAAEDRGLGAAFALSAAAAASAVPPQRKGQGRRRFPADAEKRRKVIDIPEEEKICPCCGKPRQVIGEVVTQRLGIDPPKFYVNQYVQLKYACSCEQSGVVTAEKPIQPIERGNAEPELVAFVAVSRFDDHSPYYRQEHGQFKRAGIELPRSTLCDWMRQIGQLAQPLYDLMHTEVLLSYVLGSDDTPVPLLVPGNGKTRQTHLWGWRGDDNHPYNVFDFTLGHGAAGPLKFLRREEGRPPEEGFRGYLQADAFSSYFYSIIFAEPRLDVSSARFCDATPSPDRCDPGSTPRGP